MNRYEAKIQKMKENEALLLQKAKDGIQYQNVIDANRIVKIIDYSEMNAKKYKQLVQAEKIINELTVELVNAKDAEQVKEIRVKINYYVNKIKKELQKRNVRETDYRQYCNDTSHMKKSISKYIRFMKRENKVKEIEGLYSRLDSLTTEELMTLRKLVSAEQKYIKRNMEEMKKENLPHQLHIDGKRKRKPSMTQKKIVFDQPRKKPKRSIVDKVIHFDQPRKKKKSLKAKELTLSTVVGKKYQSIDEYLRHRISVLKNQYQVMRISPFDGSFVRNIQKYIQNVPRYFYNKKVIKEMEMDTSVFMKSADLIGFIEYMKERNSLMEELKQVFSNSYMKKNEEHYLSEQERCVAWIKNFCQEKELVIAY